ARVGVALPPHPPHRLAERAAGRAGRAQGPDRVLPQAALPPWRRGHRRLRDHGMSRRVTIWSDGACSGNPGPGGWGAVLAWNGHEKELKGGAPDTTNNRMELTAAIAALAALKSPSAVDFYTDSQYLRGGVLGWIAGWKRNGWKTADRKPVKNIDLWQQ